MIIVPAIDLMDSKVVRLTLGDPKNIKTYGEDPLAFLEYFENLGFKRLHLVDLDAAFGKGNNYKIIENIAKHTKIELEVGGGIKNLDIAINLINIGVKRLIIGSLPFKNKSEFDKILNKYLANVVIGVDIKDSIVKISGWTEKTDLDCIFFLKQIGLWGIKEAIVTDISKDGTLGGINELFYKELALSSSINIIASGGIKTLNDLKKLKTVENFGVVGAIIGKAIYEGTIDLSAIKEGSW